MKSIIAVTTQLKKRGYQIQQISFSQRNGVGAVCVKMHDDIRLPWAVWTFDRDGATYSGGYYPLVTDAHRDFKERTIRNI